MIRILRHTLCLVLLLTLAACEKDREPRIEVSTGEIHLPGDASSGTTFTVSAEEPWTLSYTGEGFAVTPDGGAVFNEINTIPGFTSISMYPKAWEATGVRYTDLITMLIEGVLR